MINIHSLKMTEEEVILLIVLSKSLNDWTKRSSQIATINRESY